MMQTKPIINKSDQKSTNPRDWQDIDWKTTEGTVLQWQRRIYKASCENKILVIRSLQHRLLNSTAAKLLAIRRVTQDNVGKKTAGVDKELALTPAERILLLETLNIPTPASPLRRVWIPKPGTAEKRPLGIPTIKDRCAQALVKLAIEPEWEARFEADSYGFRPGKCAHDATAAIRNYLTGNSRYVLDADISKCFDKIDHNKLLAKLGYTGRVATQIRRWLKAGVLDGQDFSDTTAGTPQGEVISPLLANIALHGLEKHLKDNIGHIVVYGSTGQAIKPVRRPEMLAVIRYADDFVVMHPDKRIILLCHTLAVEYLASLGLEINSKKTRITHTLQLKDTDTVEEGFDGKVGFNFLGFYFCQYPSVHRSGRANTGEKLGFTLRCVPAPNKLKAHQEKLHDIVLRHGKALSQDEIIRKLNPIITGWSNYFGVSDANLTGKLGLMDYLLYLKLRKWGQRRMKGSSNKARSYWKVEGTRKWVFKSDEATLAQHTDYSKPLSNYIKIQGEKSPFDGDQKYWTDRIGNRFQESSQRAKLFKQQKGICTWCKGAFTVDCKMERDHIIELQDGGSDKLTNLQLLHKHCHDQKTAEAARKRSTTTVPTLTGPQAGSTSE